jgi:hypothetical protein
MLPLFDLPHGQEPQAWMPNGGRDPNGLCCRDANVGERGGAKSFSPVDLAEVWNL